MKTNMHEHNERNLLLLKVLYSLLNAAKQRIYKLSKSTKVIIFTILRTHKHREMELFCFRGFYPKHSQTNPPFYQKYT